MRALLILFMAISVFAGENCTNKLNLSPVLEQSKPRDQDSIGWCYAYTAADLISNKIGKKVSAVHLASAFNNTFLNKLAKQQEGGYIDSAIKVAQRNGVCLEKDLPSEDYQFSRIAHEAKLSEVFFKLSQFEKSITNNYAPSDKPLCTDTNLVASLRSFFPNLTEKELIHILTYTSRAQVFDKLVKASCQASLIKEMGGMEVKKVSTLHRQATKFAAIDAQLDQGNIVGIHYNAKILYTPSARSFFSNHASTIIGRRLNEKSQECEYLIRNSWGTGCSYYSSSYECENGNIWISEKVLKESKAIDEVIYIENWNAPLNL